ncbi:MAG: lipopolysaccharide kinase [Flavobacterium sp.]|nr:lipopolysaccharide kinase [Flavobacterium sp.]
MQIIVNKEYYSKQNAIIQLVNNFFDEGKLIVKGSRNTIKSNLLDDEKVNIKFFQKPGFLKSIIYSFFRNSKAKRSYDYANYLIQHSILTPFPIAYIEERNCLGLLNKSFYISKQIDYNFTFRELIHSPKFPDRELILQQFTDFTFSLHEANINFLDHSPGNTLIIKKEAGLYDFYLIDLNRMEFKNLDIESRMDNFKKMWLSKEMIKIIANRYSELSKHPKDELLKILSGKTKQFKMKTARKKFFKRMIGL